MTPETGNRIAYLICFVVITCAVVGYFVGLQSPMNPVQTAREIHGLHREKILSAADSDVYPASAYTDMPYISAVRATKFRTSLTELKTRTNIMAPVTINPGEKEFSLQLRQQNRAFNGAPPTIPHPIDQMNSESCMVCHGTGLTSASLQISKMSHQFLTNCTQCHVENNPTHTTAFEFRENNFVGLPAPTGGPRAYDNAPPMIPHATWMRVDCNSCHGPTGKNGLRTTHPWRINCQQCHAPSSQLEQIQLDPQPSLLPPPNIRN